MIRNMLAFKRPATATLLRVDPAICNPWVRHNRDYRALSAEKCADLIEGLKSQGRQEFPAIVRRIRGINQFEIICGARRHWAVTWLRANGHPDFKYFIDIRNMSDEEAFRLSDIENRDRADLSNYERAVDYAEALALYYNGSQKDMAAAMQVSQTWLSRYLDIAKLPPDVLSAFADRVEIKERFVRNLKPLLADPKSRKHILAIARQLTTEQAERSYDGQTPLTASQIIARLRLARTGGKRRTSAIKIYKRSDEDHGVTFSKKAGNVVLEFPDSISRYSLSEGLREFMNEHYPSKAA